MNSESHKKIEELQTIEAQLQSFLAQKQTIQVELNEIDNALEELKNSDGEVYKVISGVMLKSNRLKLEKEIGEKKKNSEMKINAVERQEKKLEQDASKLRQEINNSNPKK